MRHYPIAPLLALSLIACGGPGATPDTSDPEVAALLHQRLDGDRSRGCIAAAVIDDTVRHAIVCADGGTRGITTSSSFEIGSITKTMTGLLLADLLDRGVLALEDPLAMHLPVGTVVPTFEGQPIRLEHVVTHTAGLPSIPSRMVIDDPRDPYAHLTEEALLGSLADVTLAQAPGTRWDYSNFGFMLLTYVIATTEGQDFESLVQERLFAPLGMDHSFIASPPTGAELVRGHLSTGGTTPHWGFPDRMSGVGGVRASLDDMVAYARAVLGHGDARVVELLQYALEPIDLPHDGPPMGLAWTLPSIEGHAFAAHDGGTGGFASLIAIDRAAGRAVVLLVDTAFSNFGDALVRIGLGLLDPDSFVMPPPRTITAPAPELLDALVGEYAVDETMVVLQTRNGHLRATIDGSDPITLGYDSYGDFFSTSFEALLTPVEQDGGTYTIALVIGGQPILGVRLP